MRHVRNIIWDFDGTEFEGLLYEEVRKIVILPKNLKIKELDDDSCEEEVFEYLSENYGFDVKSFDIDE
tara:strand:- start:2743 stop:2946 length:204 start_codon:yes stop_codon:yes gene_type:complete